MADSAIITANVISGLPITSSLSSATQVIGSVAETTQVIANVIPGAKGDSGDKYYSINFTNQSSVSVEHNLSKRPAVTIIDSSGDEVEGSITHLSTSALEITFSASLTGTIFCN